MAKITEITVHKDTISCYDTGGPLTHANFAEIFSCISPLLHEDLPSSSSDDQVTILILRRLDSATRAGNKAHVLVWRFFEHKSASVDISQELQVSEAYKLRNELHATAYEDYGAEPKPGRLTKDTIQ